MFAGLRSCRTEQRGAALRILIADDHPVVLRSVCAILESRNDVHVCAEASNGAEAVKKAIELVPPPDIVILDVTMPIMDGFTAAKKIYELLKVPILILSMNDGDEMIRAAISAGAKGFINKTAVGGSLLIAVDRVMAGGTFFGPPEV